MAKKNIVIICLILSGIFLYWIASQFSEQLLIWLKVPLTGKALWEASSTQDYLGWIYTHVPALILSVVVVGLVYRNSVFIEYISESVSELQKVSYPMPKEAGQSAVAVMAIVGFCVLVLAVYDYLWQNVVLFVM